MKRFIPVLLIPFITGCYSSHPTVNCTGYDWSTVERMVEPYIDETLYTSLVMQAQSSEYNVAAAADHALGMSDAYPDSVIVLLENIKNNCVE